MQDYFYKNTRWFFALLAAYFVTTIISSFVYPDIGDVFVQNLIRLIGVILALAAAYFHKARLLHYILLIVGYISLTGFFVALPS